MLRRSEPLKALQLVVLIKADAKASPNSVVVNKLAKRCDGKLYTSAVSGFCVYIANCLAVEFLVLLRADRDIYN